MEDMKKWDEKIPTALMATGLTPAKMLYGFDIQTPLVWPAPRNDYVEELVAEITRRVEEIDTIMRDLRIEKGAENGDCLTPFTRRKHMVPDVQRVTELEYSKITSAVSEIETEEGMLDRTPVRSCSSFGKLLEAEIE
ncbi:hypothetical protein BDF20DRAFT_915693 [Mycotypha africana]|uniref:uncharacterized protein n=1 Tax=Mycotypha africana TaxID=64632 RepID=UPI002300DB30|nr:uncharacterized protein BDF20DRAFT_915693 [Mycotypha africana]KAI8971949.1 hypothetical protein BDF20DRAFT_915693 [Mycotypha africana]